VKCGEATYSGTLAVATTTTASSEAAYGECVAFGFANTPITMNGCTYRFHVEAVVSGKNEGSVDIVCPSNKVIEVEAFNCTVTIGSQNGLKSVTFTNEGSGTARDIKIDVNLTGIKYTQHGKGFFPCTSGSFTNGTYTGVATVSGEDEFGEPVGIWVE
jgi:hypothetical protein